MTLVAEEGSPTDATGATRADVLVVDDDPDIRAMIGDVLQLEGYQVVAAGSGEEAIAVLRSPSPPRLVLLDLMMPGLNGWELLSRRAVEAALARSPIVLITGDEVLADEAVALGATSCLRKPLELEELLQLVRRLCRPR